MLIFDYYYDTHSGRSITHSNSSGGNLLKDPLLLRRDLCHLMYLHHLHIFLLLVGKDQTVAIVPIVEIAVINRIILPLLLAKDPDQTSTPTLVKQVFSHVVIESQCVTLYWGLD